MLVTLLLSSTLIPIGNPPAHAECHGDHTGIASLSATPSTQTLDAGQTATIIVRAFDCRDIELEGKSIQATVTGANPTFQKSQTPFVFTYPGAVVGQDSVRFDAVGAAFATAPVYQESVTTSVSWAPTSHNVQSGGSVLKVAKNSGDPKKGAAIFECDVQAPYALEVAITCCFLVDPSGAVVAEAAGVALRGPAAATSGILQTIESSNFDVCWFASATFSTGAIPDDGCTPAQLNENA